MESYNKLDEKYIDEIQSTVTVYRHKKSGARICAIRNEDNNKVFAITFRTPPINDGGLTHILEHSVLCGSKAFPVKDPFVELSKSSLNTFLNAFTFPDKTAYPVASQNLKDFKNLMHVYMDAVFYPAIYDHEEIFKQEGWHYHLEKLEDPITINGVVYNEMKGAFSDPASMLYNRVEQALYPDTAYHYVSGGEPKYIPDLTYEVFKDFHSKFYHPSNSYIYIYGNLDMDERLEWLDKEYLSKFNAIDFDTRLTYQKPFKAPKSETYYYPIAKGDDSSNKTFLTYNVAFPDCKDNKLLLATACLLTALFDVPGAPLKQALIDAKIGQDISSYFDDGILQPGLSVIATNANVEDEEKFIKIIDEELRNLVKNGLDKKALIALLNNAEFKARERAFSPRFPQGLNIGLSVLSSWLYDDNDVYSKLEVVHYYKELKEEVNSGYFENIIDKYILNNTHKAYVKLVPSETCNDEKEKELATKLENYKKSLSKEELEKLILDTKKLAEYQNEGDTPEAIATLPKLSIEDINPNPEEYKLEVLNNNPRILFSDYECNDIAYVKEYFDISHMNTEDLLYTELLADTFAQLSTSKMNFRELNQKIQNELGSLTVGVSCYKHYVTKEAKVYFYTSLSALTENVENGLKLQNEILNDTVFSDTKRLYEYLCQMKANLDMSIVSRGHQVAMTRALSYIDEYAYDRDLTSGIAYNDFISDLVKDFELKKDYIVTKLESLKKALFSKDNVVFGFTGNKKQLATLSPIFENEYNLLPDKNNYVKEEFKENIKNEAFTAPIDINFVSRVGKYSGEFHGGLNVLDNAMRIDYLWMQVRVHGGAYGCMMNIDPTGLIGFTSYRDPNIKRTNDVYVASDKFVSEYNPDDEQLLKVKIGTIGSSESVMHVKDKADLARSLFFRGLDYSTRAKNRGQILSVTKEEINSFKPLFTEAMKDYVICCIGNTDKINEAKDMFKVVRPLTK